MADEAPGAATSITPDKYEIAAGYANTSVSEVKELEATGSVLISDNGFVLHIDGVVADQGSLRLDLPASPAGAAIPGTPAQGSRPGAPVTIFLDFDGQTLQNTNWNDETETATLNFAPAAVGSDPAFVAGVWAGVAEDYAPFNVNVTTTDPGADALYKTSSDDNQYGSHVIITDSYDETVPAAAGTSGLAWVGGTGSDYNTGALVFTEGAGGANATSADIAGVVSHEAGHNFGLSHDGIAGSTTGAYYSPTDGLWGPLMGSTYYVPISQWSNGNYAGATETEDDLAVITDRAGASYRIVSFTTSDGQPYTGTRYCVVGNGDATPGSSFYTPNASGLCDNTGAPLNARFTYEDRADYAADLVGNSPAEATALENTAGTFGAAGVIEQTGDVDVYSVITAGGAFTASVDVANILPNLDTKLTLTDANGNVVVENTEESIRVSAVEASGLGATVTATLGAGIYYLTVDGVGTGDPSLATPTNSNGYTDYGSLGNFVLSGAADPLVTEPIVIATPVDGATVVGGADVNVTGTATPSATITLTVGGAAVATATADEDGKWTASIKAGQYGKTSVVVSQQVATIAIPGTATVSVVAPVDAPVIVSPVTGTTTDNSKATISGTGIPNAKVSVQVSSTAGGFAGEAVVNADGNWEIVTNDLPVGAYTVTVNQTINEATSDDAKINFTVVAPVVPPVTNPPVTTTPTTNTNTLASTGAADSAPLALMGMLLLLAGAGSVAFRLRKKQSVQG